MAGVGKMLKQAAKMQKKMQSLQEELDAKEIEVSSGGGAVTVTISLGQEIRGLKIDPEFLKEEAAFVEETILEGVRTAYAQSKEQSETAMNTLAESMKMPGVPSLF